MPSEPENSTIAPTPEPPTEKIDVSPEQVFQKGPPLPPRWELSFVGHVLYVVALSCIIVFAAIAGVGLLLATFTDLFD
jgi:hypothetical protein